MQEPSDSFTATRGIASAIFDTAEQANLSIQHLREMGVPESAMSVISRREDDVEAELEQEAEDEVAEGVLAGAGVGAATGALFGLAAGAIPGVGPFIAGGALATALGVSTVGAATGALIGGTVGVLASTINRWGVPEAEAKYYASELDRGSTYLGIDLGETHLSRETVVEEMRRHGGRTYTE